jgi:hypothetical protein
MTLLRSHLTGLSLLVSGLCFIGIYSLYPGYSEDSVTTDVPTAGLKQEAIVKTTVLPSSACLQWMKSNVKPETTVLTVSTSPCREESLLSILDTWTY